MNNFAFTGYSSKLRIVLILSLLTIIIFSYNYAGGETIMAGQKNAMVFMGDEAFEIPKSYLSPSNELPDKIELEDTIEVSFFFPDFRGFSKGDNIATVGPYNPDQVTAFWTKINDGGSFDANRRLKNALKYELSKRDDSLDIDGLTAYKNAYNSGVTYHAQNSQGDNILIHCTEGSVNSTCKLEYLDSKSNRGIFVSFDKKYLPRWLEVNNKLLSVIEKWKV